jgi:phospholipid/cholesterol/gamma-HCH transport system substrate-binding protein
MEKKYRLKVGIFTIIAIFLIIGSYMWFTEFRLNLKRYHYIAIVDDASWLERGDIVTVMGVNKGRVEKIDIEGDKVVIKFFVDDVKLRGGVKVFVENQGFLGRKRLMIKQGNGEELPNGAKIYGSTIPDLGDLVREGGEIIDTLKKILNSVNKISKDADNALNEVKENIILLSYDFKNTSESLREFLKKGEGIENLIKTLGNIANKFDTLSIYLGKGEGTLSKIIKDESLYKRVDSLLTSINSLIKDINKNPKKYFKFSIF